jgi:hypothetical protein
MSSEFNIFGHKILNQTSNVGPAILQAINVIVRLSPIRLALHFSGLGKGNTDRRAEPLKRLKIRRRSFEKRTKRVDFPQMAQTIFGAVVC